MSLKQEEETDLSPSPASKQRQQRVTPQWKEAVAGAFSGAFSRTFMAPVERIKLLKQLQGSIQILQAKKETTAKRTSVMIHENTNRYRSLSAWEMTRIVYKEQGLLSFWRGNLPNVLRVAGTTAINFTCMDYYKNAFVAPWLEHNFVIKRPQRPQHSLNDTITTKYAMATIQMQENQQGQQEHQNMKRQRKLISSFVSGGLAGATSTTLLYPIEFARTRLALDVGVAAVDSSGSAMTPTREFNGMIDVIKRIAQSDGVFGLYQGYGISLVGGIIYRLAMFGGYDAIKNEVIFHKTRSKSAYISSTTDINLNDKNPANITLTESPTTALSWLDRLVSAQIVSLVAGTVSYPFDSVRRRMMMQAGSSRGRVEFSRDQQQPYYRNSIQCIREVWKKEGVRGFYLGIGPNIIRSIGGALVLVGYDLGMHCLRKMV